MKEDQDLSRSLMHDKLECVCKEKLQARIDMLVFASNASETKTNRKVGTPSYPSNGGAVERENKQEFKVWEQKKKAKDAKRILGIVLEKDKNKGTNHVQVKWTNSFSTTSRHGFSLWQEWLGMTSKVE